MFVTSVVRRVTMEAVENLSMLEKAKVCTLSYISCRRLAKILPKYGWQCVPIKHLL